jgi:hypothetical protein
MASMPKARKAAPISAPYATWNLASEVPDGATQEIMTPTRIAAWGLHLASSSRICLGSAPACTWPNIYPAKATARPKTHRLAKPTTRELIRSRWFVEEAYPSPWGSELLGEIGNRGASSQHAPRLIHRILFLSNHG